MLSCQVQSSKTLCFPEVGSFTVSLCLSAHIAAMFQFFTLVTNDSQTTTSISLSCCLQYLRIGPMNMWAHTYRESLDLLPLRNRTILHTLRRTVNVLLSQKARKKRTRDKLSRSSFSALLCFPEEASVGTPHHHHHYLVPPAF